ncbi:GAF domain-containing protein [Kribbella jejuensis]|uniref:GAF domain-containing protein n=1 Tax=Kribbella jejuensis TaxID=236068 RepID=A0A542ELL7_9ACTN|nr:GAF and ANTAR domain-containing protein [Kribbella jejuensis]TQJ16096.1 GAF domain-containing protein [Kribbella jejuensis]
MVDRAAVLARLARLVAAVDPRRQLVVRLCEASRQLVGARGSSININSAEIGNRLTLAATDNVAAQLENLQDILGEGPCRDAFRLNRPVVTDLQAAAEQLWPAFARSALESAGAVTIHCFPMRSAGHPFGVYSVYTKNGLQEPADVVQFLADAVGVAVLSDASAAEPDSPLTARSVVHQATGMVVVQLQVSPDDALAILRAHAFAHDATVQQIAEQIVDRRLDFREGS